MANVAVRLEYATPVHRAAYGLAHDQSGAMCAVSHAKLMACEAANLAAKHEHPGARRHGLHLGGGPAHLYEESLGPGQHLGRYRLYKARIADYIFADGAALGARRNLQLNFSTTEDSSHDRSLYRRRSAQPDGKRPGRPGGGTALTSAHMCCGRSWSATVSQMWITTM